jgi:phage baseplate assembly protein gpV
MKAVEVIKKIAENETKKLHLVEVGIVTSIFPHASQGDKDFYQCNVKLKNRDLELRKVTIATHHIGFAYVPNVGDMVLLAFINGNINAPVVIGRLYNDDSPPPVNNAGEIVYESPDQKKTGVRRMYLKFPSGIVLTITDDELKAEVGKSVVTIKTDGDITIESNAKLDIKAKGNIEIESKQSIKLTASGNVDIKGAMVNIN